MTYLNTLLACTLATLAGLAPLWAHAQGQEAQIRKNLTERLPNMTRIEEVRRTPMVGLFEVRTENNEIYYTDAEANHLIQGELIDLRQKRNLTEERLEKLNAIDFSKLPFKDSFTIVQGNGQRMMAVFADPNCGYCKRFERDLQKLDNVTIHVFIYPVLGQDSIDKSRHIWCAKDRVKAWHDWMLRGVTPSAASCDTAAIERNIDFGRKNRITGTPTTFTAGGARLPGAVPLPQLEKQL
ncbi:MAG: DsbC family protein [Alphaproteobacteria bacterium]|nr:DsbC family protein [Alphaproteobacteria bacterium]